MHAQEREAIVGALLFGLGLALRSAAGRGMTAAVPLASVPGWLGNAVLLVAYAVAGWRVLWTAARRITRWQFFDENLLMTVASIGAIAVGEISEAVGVMVFYAFGELLQARAVERSRKSIESLMDIRPETANVIRDGRIERVRPESVAPGERILVRPGERVPLDGAVVEGESFVDTSALTGESMPRAVGPGDGVLAGTINARGVLTVEVSKAYSDSSV
ncbi:MAG: heavy metal translocating P-type ATPase, partial [Firmicutes bacterium]|nr:heavy metal translocating P-type ATPase [Bacillota bacterium]